MQGVAGAPGRRERSVDHRAPHACYDEAVPLRRVSVLACVIALAAGCQSRNGKLIAGGISAGAAFGATVAIATDDERAQSVPLTGFAITSGLFALVAVLSGLSHDDELERRRMAQRIPMPDHRDEAWEHTKVAAVAARTGDCDTVLVRNRIVRELDADFHALVFLRDAAIARCLAPAPPLAHAGDSN
jgi:hypothetical protein